MSVETRKVTISLPVNPLDFADRMAAQIKITRSQVISQTLAVVQAEEEERLAAEGYGFYANESVEWLRVGSALSLNVEAQS